MVRRKKIRITITTSRVVILINKLKQGGGMEEACIAYVIWILPVISETVKCLMSLQPPHHIASHA